MNLLCKLLLKKKVPEVYWDSRGIIMKFIREKYPNAEKERIRLDAEIRARLVMPDREGEEEVSITQYLSYCGTTEFNGETVTDSIMAIQMALNAHRNVIIPYSETPIYISRSIIVNSGNRLTVHPETRIVFTTDGIFLRNRNVMDGHYNYVEPGAHSDYDIVVSGGIWEAPNTIIIGNPRPFDGYMGCDSMFLLHNVIGVRLEHICFRHSNRMCVMIGNCRNFVVEDIEFSGVNRDGIHVEGPAYDGLIRDIKGKTGDDMIALNAWDWTNASLTFGNIYNLIVEDIECEPGYLWSEMRLHPGNYVLPNGRAIECSVYNIIMQNIHGIHTVKLYNQPNLMPGYNFDKSFGLGSIYNLYCDNITFDYYPVENYYTVKNACFELHADAYNLNFSNISVNYPLCDSKYSNYRFFAVGPISATWKINDNPDDWFDFFDPDSVCHADRITMSDISVNGQKCLDADKLLYLRKQTVNPDYPKTTPAGGTGFGIVKEFWLD